MCNCIYSIGVLRVLELNEFCKLSGRTRTAMHSYDRSLNTGSHITSYLNTCLKSSYQW